MDILGKGGEISPKSQSPTDGFDFLGELGKLGEAAIEQLLGHKDHKAESSDKLSKMKETDEEFSREAEAEIRAKIQAIYDEYRARKKREEEEEEKREKLKEDSKKLEAMNQVRRARDIQANPAIAKTRAEIKNYGAE